MSYEKVEDKRVFWKPEKEKEFIEGKVIEINKSEFGKSITVMSKEGVEYVTPSHRQLQSLTRNLKLNDLVKIVFVKKEVNADKNDTFVYEVYKDVKDEKQQ